MRTIGKAWDAHNYELWTAALCLVMGVPLVARVAPSPNSIATYLPSWALLAWGVILTLGGLCTVIGILWRYFRPNQFLAGLMVEKAGQFMLGAACSSLCVAIAAYAGSRGFLVSGVFGGLGLAAVSRIRTINKEHKIVQDHGDG